MLLYDICTAIELLIIFQGQITGTCAQTGTYLFSVTVSDTNIKRRDPGSFPIPAATQRFFISVKGSLISLFLLQLKDVETCNNNNEILRRRVDRVAKTQWGYAECYRFRTCKNTGFIVQVIESPF